MIQPENKSIKLMKQQLEPLETKKNNTQWYTIKAIKQQNI